jgi:hypothetical protein
MFIYYLSLNEFQAPRGYVRLWGPHGDGYVRLGVLTEMIM